MSLISQKFVALTLLLVLVFAGIAWLFDLKGAVLLRYDAYLDSKITDRYGFFKKEIEPILLQHGKRYDLSNDQDTTNWKTYENKEYGFSFKYPENGAIDDKRAGATNDVGSTSVVSVAIDNFTTSVSVFSYDQNAYVYRGPHHAKRLFQEASHDGPGAVNYVQVGNVIGYAGYSPVNPWSEDRYNGTQYVSRFTFYLKKGMIDFNVERWGWAYFSKEKEQVYINLQKSIISTVRFDS